MSEVPVKEWRIGVRSGSTDATYEIGVVQKSKEVQFVCSCQAGILGNLCKHILAVLNGDASGLIQANQESEVRAICEAFRCTEAYPLLVEYQTSEIAKEKLEKRLKEVKKVLSKALLKKG